MHPLFPDMLNEVEHHLLLLPVRNPEDVSILKVDYYGCILMSVMQLELVYAQKARLLLRGYQRLSVNGVQVFKPLQVDVFNDVLVKPCDFCDFFVRQSVGEETFCVGLKLDRDEMLARLEGNHLVVCRVAAGTEIPVLGKAQLRQGAAERNVP